VSASEDMLVRLAAHEILLRRLIGELEEEMPGLIDLLAGPYEPSQRPTEAFDAFVAKVDDHVSLMLSQIRADLAGRH
jgi:hypothetical protein